MGETIGRGVPSGFLTRVARFPVHIDSVHRRVFLARASALVAGYVIPHPSQSSAESQPEIKTLRIPNWSTICVAPNYLAEALLRAEGFTDIEYVEGRYPGPGKPFVAPGSADFDLETAQVILTYLDAGAPLVALAGIHLGCYELFAHRAIHSIRDLKGKTIPVTGLGGDKHVFLSSMLAYVGLDPHRDVHWLEVSSTEAMELFVTGKVDAFLGFPPEPQELRAKGIGRVIVNTSTDKPWSQYYCCMLYSHLEFVRMYPTATKRIVRAILKATDLCALEPERAAREIVEKGYVQDYDYAVQTLREVPYNAWRTYAPEDTLRFYAVRLHDSGIIKATPNKLISNGTDWRFLETLKKELKA